MCDGVGVEVDCVVEGDAYDDAGGDGTFEF